ncbi:DUF4253 domain-containing protein [Phragmitibacter flavus]|uniref:DUF4253 domain-containing protein n=1 Tax=Phragmitibacter flavus TaxID=2576071 RepID=A0A5R8KJX5_9BACT|nr:DUF4253 domain-containing protein [Phragmitibacter flavus]TLD72557.1 DUF4253 domain-containing protein [Phragmitibacter flavus]
MPEDTLADYPFPLTRLSGDHIESDLLRIRSVGASLGTIPVIIGDRESAERLIELWDEPFDHDAELARSSELSPEQWFADRRQEEDEYLLDASQDEIHPDGTAPMTHLTIGSDHRGRPKSEVFIATIPTADSSAVPIFLRFGDWNACPSPHVHTAMARYWRDRFGAEIATLSSDVIEFTVARPPADDTQALELAWQQYLYCSDIVDQGVGSVATLAKALRHSTRWYFWWD